jgi:hypothetical protein
MNRRPRNNRRAMVYVSVAIAWLVGCQVIVGSDVPEFTCAGDAPGNCPTGMTCDIRAGRCISGQISEAGGDQVSPSADAGDASNDRNDGSDTKTLGRECSTDRPCPEGLICGTSSILRGETLAPEGKQICTKPCCSSADCPDSFVCFNPATSGSYCVEATRVRRSPTGATAAGADCIDSKDCRSGLCKGGRCVDSCCSDTDCTGGSVCQKTTVDVPPPAKIGWACAAKVAGATLPSGANCSGGTSCPGGNCCENRNCLGSPVVRCRPPCCTTNDCKSAGGEFAACAYAQISGTSDQTRFCIDQANVGVLTIGDTCNSNFDCQSFLCAPVLDTDTDKKCSEPCCEDANCPTDRVCRPTPNGLLRCVPKAN